MLISVIICTYARAESLELLLQCLLAQTTTNFEVIVVDGSGDNPSVRDAVASFQVQHAGALKVSLIQSSKGLTHQRNVGLRYAHGELICFLDDDVTFERDFLADVLALFERSDFGDVGGLTAYDVLNYGSEVSTRWRVRRTLGVIPSLEPGSIDRLGRATPLSFLKPFSGVKTIGHFSGFCMIYRRSAIANLRFDEQLPTYGGEDRDFSSLVGRHSRLVICGDLHIKHHRAPQSRDHDVHRTYQDGFGTGRTYAKHSRWTDYPLLLGVSAGDILVSLLAFVTNPSRNRWLFIFARPAGVLAGIRSYESSEDQRPEYKAVSTGFRD
jgi:glycosyltransferase involved in cell wall biosynthesis